MFEEHRREGIAAKPRVHRVRLNDRQVNLLAVLGEYGVLDRELCRTLCYPEFTSEWCRQILVRLVTAGLVRATALRVWHDDGSRGGRVPLLYSLTKDGADVVSLRRGYMPRRV